MGKDFIKKSEPCVLNGGTTTKCFLLERGARRGDPILAYLFLLALEILLQLIKSKLEIKGFTIFGHYYLYSPYADDTTLFLKDTISFSYFSGLKPNFKKSEIAGIGALKGFKW